MYLERGNRLTRFEPRDGEIVTTTLPLDGHLADTLEPMPLLRCQLAASEIERPGQCITLNAASRKVTDVEFFKRLQNGVDPRPHLCVMGVADREQKEGDLLEYVTAAALLKLGVNRVQRSLRLKARSGQQAGTRKPHAEVDLLFTWNGRLWLVDCKDRAPAENFADRLERNLPPMAGEARELLDRIRKELSISHTKVMKEDLLAISEAGGLLGKVVCVRKSEPPEEVLQYARLNHIDLVLKRDLVAGLRNLLHPDRPAEARQLAELADCFSGMRSGH